MNKLCLSFCLVVTFIFYNVSLNAKIDNRGALKKSFVQCLDQCQSTLDTANCYYRLYEDIGKKVGVNLLKKGIKYLLDNDDDTLKVFFYQGLAETYLQRNEDDSAQFYAKLGIVDSKRFQKDHLLIPFYKILATSYYRKQERDSSIYYYKLLLELPDLLKDIDDIGKIYIGCGYNSYHSHKYREAIDYSKKGINITTKDDDKISCLYLIFNSYFKMNKLDSCTYYCHEVLELIEGIGYEDLEQIDVRRVSFIKAATLTTLGISYFVQNDKDKAIELSKEALRISKEFNDKESMILSLNNLGSFVEENSASYTYFREALRLCKKWELDDPKTQTIINLAGYFINEENQDSAIYYSNMVLEIDSNFIDIEDQIGILLLLSKYYEKKENYHEVLKCLNMARKIVTKKSHIIYMVDIYSDLISVYSRMGLHDSVTVFVARLKSTKDSLLTLEKMKVIAKNEIKYEVKKKEQELHLLKTKEKIQSVELEKNRLLLMISFVIIIMVVVGAYLFVRKNKELKHKESVNLQLSLLQKQMNPHFIFNSLSSIQNFILNKDKKEAFLYHSKFAKLMRSILVQSREKFIPLSEELVGLRTYLELEAMRVENRFGFTINVDDNVPSESIYVPTMLIQPHLENAIWHGLETKGDRVELNISRDDHYLYIKVKDNGIGIRRASMNNGKTKQHKSQALNIIRERIKLYNEGNTNKMNIEVLDRGELNSHATGTLVILKLPILVKKDKND